MEPAMPENVVATGGDRQILLTWNPPTYNGGFVVDYYSIDASIPGGFFTTVTSTTFTIPNLTNGNLVTIQLKAHNVDGYSVAAVVSATPVAPAPGTPSDGTGGTSGGSSGQTTPSFPTPVPTVPETSSGSGASTWPIAPLPGTQQTVTMPTLTPEYLKWLQDDGAYRCLIVEADIILNPNTTPGPNDTVISTDPVTGSVVRRYLSSAPYTTTPTDTPANEPYLPYISGQVTFTEKLSLTELSLSYATVELSNTSGLLDSWLDDIWVNKPIKMYFGDVRWPRNQFVLVFSGVVDKLDSRDRTTININLRDKLQRLNNSVSETLVGGTVQAKDSLIPLVFGEVHNMTPVLIDPALHTYQYHIGNCNRVIEVRDNGAPVAAVADLYEGKFSLSGSPVGVITCSVQGDKQPDWNVTVAPIIKRLVTGFGKDTDKFTDADIDQPNFDTFDQQHQQPVGICFTEKTNVIDACQQLASSVGAQVFCNRYGLLQILKLEFPGWGTPLLITPADMYLQTLVIVERSDIQAAVKLGYCKNWTVQQNLQTGILEEHKIRFGLEWDTKTVRYSSIAQKYGLTKEPDQRDTMLLRKAEAEPEAWRLLDMLSVQRTVYQFEGLPHMLQLGLGQAVTLKHPRFGLGDGKDGVVVGLVPSFPNGHVTVQVMM